LEIVVKILSLVFPGFTFIDLAGPLQAFSLLPGAEFEFAWKERGPVPSDAGATVTAGLLEGYQAASYWYSRDVLKNYGAIPKADLMPLSTAPGAPLVRAAKAVS
jgi:putative intracellular protease/amidase